MTLAEILACIAASSTAGPDMATRHLAAARAGIDAVRDDVNGAERLLIARENEISRVSRRDAEVAK